MKIKDIVVIIGLIIASDFLVDYIHDNHHCPEQNLYEQQLNTEAESQFNIGPKTTQPWGARLFCEENPEKCGMN